MKLCIAGKNNIAVDSLYYALTFLPKEEICVVLNQTDRRRNNWQKSLGFHAELLGIKVFELYQVQEIVDITFLSLEFDKIIKPDLFKTSKLYNIHFSLLPEYKGMFTSLFPILHGKKHSGVTLHTIDSGIDTGNIIDQLSFSIENISSMELYFKYLNYGTMLIKHHMKGLLFGKPASMIQPSNNSSYYSKKSFDFRNNEILPFQTAEQIKNFTNALNFRVYQQANFMSRSILKCDITENKSILKPGTIIDDNVEFIEIATIDYDVRLYIDYYYQLLDCCRKDDFILGQRIVGLVHDIDECDINGWTPLIVACYNGATEMIRILLKYGADPNKTNLNGTTPLMYAKDAVSNGHSIKLLQYLINYKANPLLKDIWGRSITDYTSDPIILDLLMN